MRRVRTVVDRSEGKLQFLPLRELWAVSGVLADTFPLDRELVHSPRFARQLANWTRLVLVDRAVSDEDRTAMLTLSDTPWVPAVAVGVVAALVAPRLPRWLRLVLFGGGIVWIVRGRRASRYVALRRELRQVAPGGVLVADFVALEPGAGMHWVVDALESIGEGIPFIALLPASGDARRDAARERLYVRQLGFRRSGETVAGGQSITVLVRD
jgi:hypothetical protein